MDNLRYISLQYIKGDNYEKIQCFKYEEALELLDEIIETQDYSKPTFDALEEIMEEEKCPIGESFLNDLVNYYNFKDIKEKIEGVKKGIEYTGYDSKDGDTRTELIKSLNELIKGVGKLDNEDIGAKIKATDVIVGSKDTSFIIDLNWLSKKVIKKYITDVLKRYNTFKELASKYDLDFEDIEQGRGRNSAEQYKAEIETFSNFLIDHQYSSDTEVLKDKLKNIINYVLKQEEGKKEHLLIYLNLLKVVLLYENNLDAIMALFNKYIKICKRNIGKYEDLFSKNDISNIDDAFMIKSYATFLHKLETLKKNLESKDKTKLERALTNALERLFDLYGINDTETIINDAKSPFYDRLFI
jgi:hypothetical protein